MPRDGAIIFGDLIPSAGRSGRYDLPAEKRVDLV